MTHPACHLAHPPPSPTHPPTVLMRCAGFDKINLAAAAELGIRVARVPAYSPDAVAQHAVALMLALKWRLTASPAASSASQGAIAPTDFANTTVGVLGTGRIGYLFAKMVQGFGCKVPRPPQWCPPRRAPRLVSTPYHPPHTLQPHTTRPMLISPIPPAPYYSAPQLMPCFVGVVRPALALRSLRTTRTRTS